MSRSPGLGYKAFCGCQCSSGVPRGQKREAGEPCAGDPGSWPDPAPGRLLPLDQPAFTLELMEPTTTLTQVNCDE